MTTRTRSTVHAGLAIPEVSRQTLGLVVLAALGLCAGYILTRPDAPHTLVALSGALLALGVPGLACTRALFPGRGLGQAEHSALVVGIQLSLMVVCGFLLHLLRPGLAAASWGALLADITLAACLVAWIRGRGLATAPDVLGAVQDARTRTSGPGWPAAFASATGRQLAMLAGAGLLVLGALGIARMGASIQPQPAWTALAITPADNGHAVTLAITNAEGHDETYRVVVRVDGETLTTVAAVPVGSGGGARLDVPLPDAGAFLRQVEVDLWPAAVPASDPPYRSVSLSVRGVPGT